jgi:hypothetical protein
MDWLRRISEGSGHLRKLTENAKKIYETGNEMFGAKQPTVIPGDTVNPYLGAGIGRNMGGWSQQGRIRRGRRADKLPYKPVARRPLTPASQAAVQSTIGGSHRIGKRNEQMGKALAKIYNGKQQRKISRITKKNK